MLYVGIDASLKTLAMCAVSENGTVVEETTIANGRAPLDSWLTALGDDEEVLVGLEACDISVPVADKLEALGQPFVLMETHHAAAMIRGQERHKNDPNDARGLAELLRLGAFKEVWRKSASARTLQSLLSTRDALMETRKSLRNSLRALVRLWSAKEGRITAGKLIASAIGCANEQRAIAPAVHSLMRMLEELDVEVLALDQEIERVASDHDIAQRLMTVPGVGPLTALAFIAAIDEPKRFRSSREVGAYLGLVPRLHQSGEVTRRGRITKSGNRFLRKLLDLSSSRRSIMEVARKAR